MNDLDITTLILEHAVRLESFVCRQIATLPDWMRSQLEPDEVIQSTYVVVLRKIDHFSPEHSGSFLAWLRVIAQNQISDRRKQLQRRREQLTLPHKRSDEGNDVIVEHQGTTDSPSRIVFRRERTEELLAIIDTLPREQKEAISLQLRGASRKEIAVQLRKSESAIGGILYRAKTSIRAALGESIKWLTR